MKTVDIFVVDDSGKVLSSDTYNVVKILREDNNNIVLLVLTYLGDVAVVNALKDYSVTPYRVVVRNKLLVPFLDSQEED